MVRSLLAGGLMCLSATGIASAQEVRLTDASSESSCVEPAGATASLKDVVGVVKVSVNGGPFEAVVNGAALAAADRIQVGNPASATLAIGGCEFALAEEASIAMTEETGVLVALDLRETAFIGALGAGASFAVIGGGVVVAGVGIAAAAGAFEPASD
jgi:hypothetical protein